MMRFENEGRLNYQSAFVILVGFLEKKCRFRSQQRHPSDGSPLSRGWHCAQPEKHL